MTVSEQLSAIYCATYTLAQGSADSPYLLKSANLSDVDDPDVSRANIGAAESGANTDITSITQAAGSLSFHTGAGANTADFDLNLSAGMVRVTAQAINFRAAPTTTGNGLVFQNAVGVSVAQLYNIVGSSTYLDFDTALTIRAGYSGGTVISVTAARTTFSHPVKLQGYTVATLPAGSAGDEAYVTDATAPTYNGALVGGGAVVVPVFFNGAAWRSC